MRRCRSVLTIRVPGSDIPLRVKCFCADGHLGKHHIGDVTKVGGRNIAIRWLKGAVGAKEKA